jgi:hypothetical protein
MKNMGRVRGALWTAGMVWAAIAFVAIGTTRLAGAQEKLDFACQFSMQTASGGDLQSTLTVTATDLAAATKACAEKCAKSEGAYTGCAAAAMGGAPDAALGDYLMSGLSAMSKQMNFNEAQTSAYYASYKKYLDEKNRENLSIQRCAKEDPKKPSRFCVNLRKAFIESLKEQARTEAKMRKTFIDECKKDGGEPRFASDFWDCQRPTAASRSDGKSPKKDAAVGDAAPAPSSKGAGESK